MSLYCRFAPGHPYHGPYHDREYGFPVRDDSRLLERLALEINQAGLSWLTILKKRENFREAFQGFDPGTVALFGRRERARLLRDPGIIRNRMKIDAVIENARRIVALQKEGGSFAGWLDAHHPRSKPEWVQLFRRTFLFTGGEITGEFLVSTGYLGGAHTRSCPIYQVVVRKRPPWLKARLGRDRAVRLH